MMHRHGFRRAWAQGRDSPLLAGPPRCTMLKLIKMSWAGVKCVPWLLRVCSTARQKRSRSITRIPVSKNNASRPNVLSSTRAKGDRRHVCCLRRMCGPEHCTSCGTSSVRSRLRTSGTRPCASVRPRTLNHSRTSVLLPNGVHLKRDTSTLQGKASRSTSSRNSSR